MDQLQACLFNYPHRVPYVYTPSGVYRFLYRFLYDWHMIQYNLRSKCSSTFWGCLRVIDAAALLAAHYRKANMKITTGMFIYMNKKKRAGPIPRRRVPFSSFPSAVVPAGPGCCCTGDGLGPARAVPRRLVHRWRKIWEVYLTGPRIRKRPHNKFSLFLDFRG